jgi:YD repeat-containing protein
VLFRSTWGPGTGTVPADIADRFRWRLAEVIDTHGNTVTYDYDCATLPACWPSRIAYGPYEVVFHSEANPTPLRHATGKTIAVLDRRLRSIEVNVVANGSTPASRVGAWRFDHATSPATGLPRLTSIVEFGNDAVIAADGSVTGSALPSTNFGYSGTAAPTMVTKSGGPNQPLAGFPGNTSLLYGDFDGNGKFDATAALMTPDGPDQTSTCAFSDLSTSCYPTPTSFSAMTMRLADDPRDGALLQLGGTQSHEPFLQTLTYIGIQHDGSGVATCTFTPADNGVGMAPQRPILIDYFGTGKQALLDGFGLRYCGWDASGTAPLPGSEIYERDAALSGLVVAHGAAGVPKVGDLDGDGREDLFYVDPTPTWNAATSKWRFDILVARADGKTWSLGTALTAAVPGTAGHAPTFVVGDVDGDGRSDIAFPRDDSGTWTVLRSTGTGFLQDTLDVGVARATTCALFSTDPQNVEPCARITDLDGNGLPEILVPTPVSGSSQLQHHLVSNLGASTFDVSWLGQPNLDFASMIGDVDGDGRLDLMSAYPMSSAYWGRWYSLSGTAPDLLNYVSAPHGGITTVTYGSSSQWSNTLLRQNRQTVVSVTENDARGTLATTSYAYAGGLYDYTERRFLGFRAVTETLPLTGDETVAPTRTYTFRQDLPAAGRVEKLEVKTGDGRALRTVRHEYDTTARAETDTVPAYFNVREAAVETTDYDWSSGSSVARSTRVGFDQDKFGNVIRERRLGRLDTGADDRTVQRNFPANAEDYIVGLKGSENLSEVVAGVTTYRAKVTAYFDGQTTAAAPIRGDVTRLYRWNDQTNSWVYKRYDYDGAGNRIRSADETGDITVAARRTDIAYDTTWNLFPVTETTPANEFGSRLVTSTAWNVRCGKPSSITDPNGAVTTTTYDRFCRIANVDNPLGDYEHWTWTQDRVNGWKSHVVAPAPTGQTAELFTDTLYDGFARAVKVTKSGASAAQPIVVETGWDGRGRKASETLPRYEGGAVYTRTFAYDTLDRPILSSEPDGADTVTTYGLSPEALGHLAVTVTDPNGNVAVTHTDGFGRDIRRDRVLSSTQTAITRITRDAMGRVTGIVDPIGATWANTWDSLGRRTAATDPDLGTWTYTYDNAGRLKKQTDARGNVVDLTYDNLGRLLSRTVTPSGGTAEVTRSVWDEVRTGYANLGRLSREASAVARVCHDHDLAGRIVRDRWTLPADTGTVCELETPPGAESFTLVTTWDAGGRATTRTWPDGDTTGTTAAPMTYDYAGRLRTIPGAVTAFAYDAAGHTTSATYTNGVVSTFAYDPWRAWLTSVAHARSGTALETAGYEHDAGGRITRLTSSLVNRSWSYTYDRLDRLTKATNLDDANRTRNYWYDLGSRFTAGGGNGAYTYDAARPHARRPSTAPPTCGTPPAT